MRLKEIAAEYARYGLNAIPTGISDIGDNSRKVPFRTRVRKWQQVKTADALHYWDMPDMDGIGIATGKISNGLEVLDIDSKYDITGNVWENLTQLIQDNLGEEFFNALLIETSPSGGFHIMYRCSEIEGNLKLANRPATMSELSAKPKTKKYCIIETRGEGGFIVCAPTNGYNIVQGDFPTIRTITPDERSVLLDCARSLDTSDTTQGDVQANSVSSTPNVSQAPIQAEKKLPPFEVTPWDDYNQKNKILDVIFQYGWQVSEGASRNGEKVSVIYPGKKNRRETAATAHVGRNLLIVYSTNAGIESDGNRKGITPFGIYCRYEHNNNKDAAIRALYEKGYGKPKERPKTVKASRLQGNAPQVEITHIPERKAIEAADAAWIVQTEEEKTALHKAGIMYAVTGENVKELVQAVSSYTKNITMIFQDGAYNDIINRTLPYLLQAQTFPCIYAHHYDNVNEWINRYTEINESTGEVLFSIAGRVEDDRIGWVQYRLRPIRNEVLCEKLSEQEKNRIAQVIAAEVALLDYSRHALILGMMKERYLKFLRDTIKAAINERKAEERNALLSNADITGVIISAESGTEVMNQYNQLIQVTPYELAYPYQLPMDAANECDWVVEVKGESFLQYLRIPNAKIGSVISVKNIFRNARIRINIDANQLDRLNSHLIMQSKTAEAVQVLGWHPEAKMWFFADRAYCPFDDIFYLPNEVSIIEKGDKAYYLPYVDKNAKAIPEILAFCYRPSSISFHTASTFIRKAWGDKVFVLFIREIASWFLDYVSVAANPLQPFFPIGFVQGKASSGKSTFAGIFKFFYASQLPIVSLRMNNTQAGIVSAMQMARNITIPFDDYGDPDAQMNVGDVSGMLVSLWNLRVGLKMNVENFAARANSSAYSAALVSSNYPPKDQSNALQTRLIYTRLDTIERTDLERENFGRSAEKIYEQGMNDAFIEVLKCRPLIEKHFKEEYKSYAKTLKGLVAGYSIESRIIDDYALVGAVAKVLIEKGNISIGGISIKQLNDILRDNIVSQYNSLVQKEPLALFWEYIQQGYEQGFFLYGHDFDMDTSGFRLKDGSELMEGEVLFVRMVSLYRTYVRVCQMMGRKPEQESQIKTLLKEHASWESKLLPDESRETSDVKVRRFDRKKEDLDRDPSLPPDFPTTCYALYYEALQRDFDIDFTRRERGNNK